MTAAEIVDALYRAFLGRGVDPSGLAFWIDLMHSTGDATIVLRGILDSEEYARRSKADCLLANFERTWRTHEHLDALRCLVAAQIRGELFPNVPEASEPSYYFLHIPKTAGSSTIRFLDSLCPRLRVGLWDQLIELERIGAPISAPLVAGHFHMHLEPFLGQKRKRFTILRDPVARTISHYLHVKRAREHPYSEMVQSMSLLEFCTHPKTRHMVVNYQARFLVDFGIDPRVPGALCTQQELSSFQLQDLMDRLTLDAVPEDLLLSATEANLASFAAVGITEKFPEAMRQFATVFGREEGSAPYDERHNLAPEPLLETNLDAKTRLAILGAVQVDLALYRRVSVACV